MPGLRNGGRLRKPARREKLSESVERALRKFGVGIRNADNFERVNDVFAANGVRGDSVNAIAKIHGAGARWMAKGSSLPSEDSGTEGETEIAETGATNNWHDEIDPRAVSPKPTLATPPHAASMRALQPLQTSATAAAMTRQRRLMQSSSHCVRHIDWCQAP
jgi:hypothetical protein